MKLLRYGPLGAEKPAALHLDGSLRDMSAHIGDIDAAAISPAGLVGLQKIDLDQCPIVAPEARLGTCVAGTGKFVCVGLNYSDHAAEAGMVYQLSRSCL